MLERPAQALDDHDDYLPIKRSTHHRGVRPRARNLMVKLSSHLQLRILWHDVALHIRSRVTIEQAEHRIDNGRYATDCCMTKLRGLLGFW